jgi:hypothetical protein
MVLVGGWVPELLLPASHPPHTGSLDVDVLLDSSALTRARVQELIGELHARHYRPTAKRFRFEKNIDLGDGGPSVVVGVDFLAPTGGVPDRDDRTQGGFRAFEVDGAPRALSSRETVLWPVAPEGGQGGALDVVIPSVEAFIVMKAFALRSRVKPKDAYDVVFILKNWPGGPATVAARFGDPPREREVTEAMRVLAVWFASPNHLGPRAYAGFFDPPDRDSAEVLARDAFERVQALLRAVGFDEKGE